MPLSSDIEFRTQRRTADQTHAYIHDQGFLCESCGHRHGGDSYQFACSACKCARRSPTVLEFEKARSVEFAELIEHVTENGDIFSRQRIRPKSKPEVH